MVEAMRGCFAIDAFHAGEVRLEARATGATVHLTKHPNDLSRVGPRLLMDPRLYVLCMVRDPRDIIVSVHWPSPDRYFVSADQVLEGATRLRRLAPHARFIPIRYEDLVTDPSGVQRAIESRLPFLTRVADFREFHRVVDDITVGVRKDLRGLRPIDADSVGNWRRHLPRVADQRHPLTEALVALAYESDDTWERALDGVEPVAQFYAPSRVLWIREPFRSPLRTSYRLIRRQLVSLLTWVSGWREGVRGRVEYFTRSPRC